MPLASILVPMRNAEPYVQATLDSLLHDDIDVEVIVIDDQSSDGSAAVVRAYGDARITLVPGPGRGISAALNAGLAHAHAPLLMRCDADDLFPAGRLLRQIRWMAEHAQFGALCGGFSAVDERGRLVAELPTGAAPTELTEELREGHTRTHLGTFAMRTQLVNRIGGFREFFATAEDIDVQLRLARHARVMYLPGECYRYRFHDQSITHTQARAHLLQYADAARRLQRQRRADGRDDLDLGLEVSLAPPASSAPEGATSHLIGLIEGAAWTAHAQGRRLAALRTGMRALRYRRWHLPQWRTLLALLLKPVAAPTGSGDPAAIPGTDQQSIDRI